MDKEKILGIREGCTVLFLAINGWKDWKKQEISLAVTGVYGGIGVLLNIISERNIWNLAVPVGLGILFLLIGLISGGKLGMGDGWVLTALGVMLDVETYLRMLCGGLLLSAITAVILLTVFRKNRKTEIPFVPFLFFAYLGGVLA